MPENISPDNLIPADSELGQLLLQLSGDSDDRVWKIANITNDLIDELEGGIVTKQQVYKAVARRCKGRKTNTVRRWAELARDYGAEIQAKYAELLSFEHFKVSRRLFIEGYTPTLEYGLQWCIEGNDYKLNAGKFKTVGEMLNHFVPEYRREGLGNYWGRIKENLYDKFLLIDHDNDRQRLMEAWQTIEFILDKKPVL